MSASMPLNSSMNPPLLKEGAVSIVSSSLPLLGGRVISSWGESLMIFGVVAAVVGVAAAVFTGSAFAGMGFALLGVISITGVFISQDALEGARLQNSITMLNRQNALLGDQTNKIQLATQLVVTENIKLKESSVQLNQKAAELERQNQMLVETNKELETSLKEMAEANKTMTENRAALGRKVTELQHFITMARGVLQGFLRTNVDFAARVGAFASSVSGLGRSESSIREALGEFDRVVSDELPILTAQVQLARELSDHIRDHMSSQNQHLNKLADDYRDQVSRLEISVAAFTAERESLESLSKGLAEREASLTAATTSMEAQKHELLQLTQALDSQERAISESKELLAVEVTALSRIKEELMSELPRLRSELDHLIASKTAEQERVVTTPAADLSIAATAPD